MKNIRSIFLALPYELAGWNWLTQMVHARGEQWSQGALWPSYIRFARSPENQSGWSLEHFERFIGPRLPTVEGLGIPPIVGRLGQSLEGRAKRRIFAIGNSIKKRLLSPIHDWLMRVLARIPEDGTFKQDRPLDRLVGEQHCYSFDFKSATDRWPLLLLFEVMQYSFDRSFASSVVSSALAYNI